MELSTKEQLIELLQSQNEKIELLEQTVQQMSVQEEPEPETEPEPEQEPEVTEEEFDEIHNLLNS